MDLTFAADYDYKPISEFVHAYADEVLAEQIEKPGMNLNDREVD